MFDSLFSRKGLSHDRLRTLVEVQEAGSIVAAAPDSQHRPGQYSRQLSELTGYFETPVTRREGKVIKLTPFGSELANASRDFFRRLEDLKAEARGHPKQYRIAAGDGFLQWLVIPRLRATIRRESFIFSTANLTNQKIVDAVHEGLFDFGIVRRDSLSRGTKCHPLGRWEYTGVVPAAVKPVSGAWTLKRFLREAPLAVMSSPGQFTSRLRTLFEKHAGSYGPGLLCQSYPQVLSAVRSGQYGAIVPKLALADLPAGSYTVVPSSAWDGLSREEALIWNQARLRSRPGAEIVCNHLKEALCIK